LICVFGHLGILIFHMIFVFSTDGHFKLTALTTIFAIHRDLNMSRVNLKFKALERCITRS